MTGSDDAAAYGDQNDLAPGESGPREPRGEPAVSTDQFDIWLFEDDAAGPHPDVYVVTRAPDPLDFRMWVFASEPAGLRFVMRASHRYSPAEAEHRPPDDCCEVLLAGESLRARHCPAAVKSTVQQLTGGDVHLPKDDSEGHGGPISY